MKVFIGVEEATTTRATTALRSGLLVNRLFAHESAVFPTGRNGSPHRRLHIDFLELL